MKPLRRFLNGIAPHFESGGRLEKLYSLFEATDTILYTPGTVTAGAPHVRDALNLKRMMIAVVLALSPTVAMALYNTGLQANLAMQQLGMTSVEGWRGAVLGALGAGVSPVSPIDNVVHGALYFVPLYLIMVIAVPRTLAIPGSLADSALKVTIELGVLLCRNVVWELPWCGSRQLSTKRRK